MCNKKAKLHLIHIKYHRSSHSALDLSRLIKFPPSVLIRSHHAAMHVMCIDSDTQARYVQQLLVFVCFWFFWSADAS